MPDLTELQRLAEGARHAGGGWWHTETLQMVLVPSEADYIAAMSPDTAKKLIAVALAAQRVVAEGADQWGAIPKLRTALEELK